MPSFCRSLRSFARMSTLILMAFLTYPVLAEDMLSTEPLLQLNTDRHTASIARIATDAQNRFVVTASEDKTARVWSLPDGQLQTILRVPTSDGNIGKLYAVALTPDGSTVAVGGWTGAVQVDTTSTCSIESRGALKQRLSGLPNVIDHLAYSNDGRYLAATLGGKSGIRVFDVASGYTACPAISTTMIAQAGRTSMPRTGWSQLHPMASCVCMRQGTMIDLLRRCGPNNGEQPFSVAFSPDGQRVAVGFFDSPNVVVLSAAVDLRQLYEPDVSGINRNLFSVAWSRDGRQLYRGGTIR